MIREDLPLELQVLDEREEPKAKQGREGVIVTLVLILVQGVDVPLLEGQGAVDIWGGDVVPAETRRRASFESRDVVREVGNKHPHDLWGEPALVTTDCGSV